MISRSLQRDLDLANKSLRCKRTGGHKYGKAFRRGRFLKVKCKRCKQEIVVIEDELDERGYLK